MRKKLCLLLLVLSILFSFCACNIDKAPQLSSESTSETTQESSEPTSETTNIPSESTVDTTEETPEQSTTENGFSEPHPVERYLFSFENLNDYKVYLQSENYDLPLLESELFEVFGSINEVQVKTLNSSDDFQVEYECSYRENDNRNDIRVEIYSMSQFQSTLDLFSESAILETSDVGDILPGNVESYWLKTSETEEECADLYAKYYPNGTVPIRYRLSDQVFVYYYLSDFYGVIFVFDACVVRVQFYGYNFSDYFYLLPDSIICPTTRALLTKTTASQAAEELYNLWKDALK